jgi:hypothetical protein
MAHIAGAADRRNARAGPRAEHSDLNTIAGHSSNPVSASSFLFLFSEKTPGIQKSAE